MTIKIAIDGPAGAGKSTIAKKLADLLGYIYIDTGSMYRAVTYKVLKENIDINDENEVYSKIVNSNIYFEKNKIFLDNIDITDEIRKPYINDHVSNISKIKKIREILVKKQQDMAFKNNVVMDGRDIGSVVLPDAQYKFFLTASLSVRAKRRYNELKSKKFNVEYDKVLKEIQERDINDSTRDIAPLIISKDAIVIDTSDLTIDEVINKIYKIIKENEN